MRRRGMRRSTLFPREQPSAKRWPNLGECRMGSTSQPEDINMTLNPSKTFMVLSAAILLVATCAALAKTVTGQSDGPAFPQRALTIEEFPELFTVISP